MDSKQSLTAEKRALKTLASNLPAWAKPQVQELNYPQPIIILLDQPIEKLHTERLKSPASRGLNVLACGAGMQSTALALMSAENQVRRYHHSKPDFDFTLQKADHHPGGGLLR